ncbi:TRAP transporter large permease [Aestuariivita sp.]|jgi:tripartite ATP-independent transporter DctM subunit|uniref:TRAP transporter large permease n=1 Tax=Aestuariivita sp. TaxID=1872407 RepID=UPI00216C4DE0|nr:TRAP transporter large permease [Aestuariivita sp.]MCE8008159.1 TRAP transporter large permease [Aestuariivita sp.]
MSWAVFLIIAIGLLLTLLFSGTKIFVGFLALNLVGVMLLIGPRGFGLFTNSMFETATSPTLMTVALFVLMGEILFRSGTVEVLFNSVDRLVGGLRGRLYVVTIALSTVFGALSGSAVAVAAMLGRSVLPQMQDRGYDPRLSAGTILAGASLAPIIPPSLLAIIVGSLADVSIAGLLVAGILPGLLFAALTLGYVFLRDVPPPAPPQAETGSALRAVLKMTPFLLVIFAVMGLILLGIATPSESAATGVVGALIVAAISGRLSLALLREAIGSAVITAGVILIIICSAKLFSQLLSFAGATRGLVSMMSDLGLGPDMTFLLMMLIPFVLCMFIDQIAFMLLAIPIYQPIVAAMGFDPIWFWTLFMINLTVGSLTPPFGYTLFALKGASDRLSTGQVFGAAWPVVAIFVTGMVVLWAVPGLVTTIPGLIR